MLEKYSFLQEKDGLWDLAKSHLVSFVSDGVSLALPLTPFLLICLLVLQLIHYCSIRPKVVHQKNKICFAYVHVLKRLCKLIKASRLEEAMNLAKSTTYSNSLESFDFETSNPVANDILISQNSKLIQLSDILSSSDLQYIVSLVNNYNYD